MIYDYHVRIGIRQHESEPWNFDAGPVASFLDRERAIRFAKSEVRSGWGKDRVKVLHRMRVIWPKAR